MAASAAETLSSYFSVLFLRSTRHSLSSISLRRLGKCPRSLFLTKPFSNPATRYPLQYEMIVSRPNSPSSRNPRTALPPRANPPESSDSDSPDADPSSELSPELSFEDWVDKKLTQNSADQMDKAKRKYYNKRRKRMYGSDSEDEERRRREKGELVELKPEVVELRTLHKREEELYFYDAFALPWEKDKHYKMVYQLEKKYFPDQCLDKAFLEPGQSNLGAVRDRAVKGEKKKGGGKGEGEKEEDKGLVFFEGERDDALGKGGGGGKDISERKVEEFFKCLKKVPSKSGDVSGNVEPFLASRSTGLPPQWDAPGGTVVLVNKPKGESFIVYFQV